MLVWREPVSLGGQLRQQIQGASACVLPRVSSSQQTTQQTETEDDSDHLWEENDKDSWVASPGNQTAPQIFSPANLDLQSEKRDCHHSPFRQTLQAEVWEADLVRNPTFCSLYQGPWDLSAALGQEAGPSQLPAWLIRCQEWGNCPSTFILSSRGWTCKKNWHKTG